MKKIGTNSDRKTISFQKSGDNQIGVFAYQDNEYWFCIGWYSSLATAKRYAKSKMAKLGYTLNERELKNFISF